MFKGYRSLLFTVCALATLCICSAAQAAGQGWEIVGTFAPTNLTPGGGGTLELYVYDTGAVASEGTVTVTDTLPAGVVATGAAGCTQTGSLLTCELSEGVAVGGPPALLSIPVSVAASVRAGSEAIDRATVSGGGTANAASTAIPVKFGAPASGLGFSIFDGWYSNANGTTDTQAGSHPYELTLALGFNNDGTGPTGGEARELNIDLPPGLISNSRAVPQCERALFDAETGVPFGPGECPPSTVIGQNTIVIAGHGPVTVPVYNLQPPSGVMAEFAFAEYSTHTIIDASLRATGDGYGVTEHFGKVPQLHVLFDSLTLWGVPAEESLDSGRTGGAADTPPAAFLTLPDSCGAPPPFSAEVIDTWADPTATAAASFPGHNQAQAPLGLTGCDHLGFAPTLSVAPDTSHADTPAGLTVEFAALQEALADPRNLAVANMREETVTLPQGVAVNPGFANALQACQSSEAGLQSGGPPSCPASSRIGEVELETPLIKQKLTGGLYLLASQPPAISVLASASADGVNLDVQGTLHLNEGTGQPTLTLEEAPQLPISQLRVIFDGGARAVLVTPPVCGQYTTGADFAPSGSPFQQDVFATKAFAIESGPGGAPCTAALPFQPVLSAGSSTDQAGGYVSFSVLLERGDGQQRISSTQVKLPPGLLGMIAKVPLCGEPQAATGGCPQASAVGHAVLGAGPGPYPLFIPQAGQPAPTIYLTGPYQGAPYGLSIVLPLSAGPFDLGSEVLRARIEVDPHTGQLTIITGALPQIVRGIPLDLRTVDLDFDRPGFMFNPTDCDPTAVVGAVSSFEGAHVPVESHFQVGSCQALKFEPQLTLATAVKGSKAGAASLTAKLSYPAPAPGAGEAESQANVRTLKLTLPKKLTLSKATQRQACSERAFTADPASCPAASVLGHATALTPVLPGSLSGPAYYVARAGQKLPALEVVLQGAGVTLDLEGSTATAKSGVSSVTVGQLPDIPLGSLELTLAQGPHAMLTAAAGLCKATPVAPVELVGQNGAVIERSTKLAVGGCPKARKSKAQRRTAKRRTKQARPTKHARGRRPRRRP